MTYRFVSLFLALTTLLTAFILNTQETNAATIHGTIYDLDLDPISDAIITIEGPTRQIIVTKNGTYTAEIPIGTYTITVKKNNETIIKEQAEIKQDTPHALDLITLQLLDIELDNDIDEGLADVDDIQDEPTMTTTKIIIITATILTITLIAIVFYYQKNNKQTNKQQQPEQTATHEIRTDAQELLSYIKKQDGRTTQKNIRKEFPHSEAKISLILAELENKKLITKIKKGRGNIIILK